LYGVVIQSKVVRRGLFKATHAIEKGQSVISEITITGRPPVWIITRGAWHS